MQGFNHQQGHYLRVDDARIYYEDQGDKSLPVLLMLHGGMGNIESFNSVLAKLPNAYRVVGVDTRGHGGSTLGTQAFTYALFQKEVEMVLKHLDIKTLSILGFSNGGTIAYRLAAFSDLEIQRMVTIGSPWNFKHMEPMIEKYASLTINDWILHCSADYQAYQRLNPEPDIQLLYERVRGLGVDTGSSGFPNEQVQNIKTKVLITRGEYDPILNQESAETLSQWVEGAQMISLPAAGHGAMSDQPAALAHEIIKFLAS